ncbi:MAG: hypothetical protein VX834_13270 [Myxococcota bacterium]|nr:hypothetical protein [Myxococcota bacterium]
MTIAAVVDVGTNAIRLAWSEVDGAGVLRRSGYERFALRLGTDVFEVGKLRKATIDELVSVFDTIATTMNAVGVTRYRAVATSAMRGAANSGAVCKRIKRETGLELEVISGEQESYFSREALGRAVGGVGGATLLIDLGGGSLELERADGGFVQSIPFGTVRVLNQYPELREPLGPTTLEHYRDLIYRDLHGALKGCRAGKVAVGTGGNLDLIARVAPSETGMVPAIDAKSLTAMAAKISVLTLEERMRLFGMREDRADLAIPGILVVEAIIKHFKLEGIQVPGSGMREALLYDQQIASLSASNIESIALRFGGDLDKHRLRMEIARGLFASLFPLHQLYLQAERILELALALADSGALIGPERALEHTVYIAEHLEDSRLDAQGHAMLGYILSAEDEQRRRRYGRRLRAAQRRSGDVLTALYQIALALTRNGVRKPPKLTVAQEPKVVYLGRSWSVVEPYFRMLGEQLGCRFEQAA